MMLDSTVLSPNNYPEAKRNETKRNKTKPNVSKRDEA